jgi:hypothetical protein
VIRAERLDPDHPAAVTAINFVRWELSICQSGLVEANTPTTLPAMRDGTQIGNLPVPVEIVVCNAITDICPDLMPQRQDHCKDAQ